MSNDRWAAYGAAAGVIAILLYLVGSLIIGTPPDFDASGAEIATHVEENRTRIQIGSAFHAAWPPLFVWFLATVTSLARPAGPAARRAGTVAFGCGVVFVALFLADVTSLAVSALRPENLASAPELAAALHDFEWLAMGMGAFLVAGVLAAFAVLALRDKALWPEWLGWLATAAALAYTVRVGSLFTTEGPFAADGVFGLYVPVSAVAAWMVLGSVTLTLRVRRNGADGATLTESP